MNHSKTLLLLALIVPGLLSAQQQQILQHAPAELAAPQTSENMQLELAFADQRLSLQLWENSELLQRLAAHQRNRLRQQGARYFTGHVDGDSDSWLRLSWLPGAWEGIVHTGGVTWLLDRRDLLQDLLLKPQRSQSTQIVYRA